AWVEAEVLRSGVDLRRYRGRMVYAKVAAIDSTWATVGSHNLDRISMEKLSELNVEAHDSRVAGLIERRIFEVDIFGSDPAVARGTAAPALARLLRDAIRS